MLTLADAGLVFNDGGVWTQTDEMATLLSGDNSYADYLGGQIMQQMAPRLTLGHAGENLSEKNRRHGLLPHVPHSHSVSALH